MPPSRAGVGPRLRLSLFLPWLAGWEFANSGISPQFFGSFLDSERSLGWREGGKVERTNSPRKLKPVACAGVGWGAGGAVRGLVGARKASAGVLGA